MFRTTSDTSTTVSPLSTPNFKSSKKSSFMVLSSSDIGFATIPDYARRVHSLRMVPAVHDGVWQSASACLILTQETMCVPTPKKHCHAGCPYAIVPAHDGADERFWLV